MPIKILGRKGLFPSHFHITVHQAVRSGNEARQESRIISHAGMLLADLLLRAHLACFLIEPRVATILNGLGPSPFND